MQVEVGLINETYAQILSGLSEGDQILLPYSDSIASTGFMFDGASKAGDGYRFTLTYKTTGSETDKFKAEIIQQQLKDIGIKLEVRRLEWNVLFSAIKSGDFQLYSLQWVGISEPDIYYLVFSSESLPPRGANRGHYLNPDLDRLILAGRREISPKKRKEIYSGIQKIVAYDLPYVSLWHPTNVVIMKGGLTGFTPYPDGDLSSLWRIRWSEAAGNP